MDCESRQSRLRNALGSSGIDALLVTHLPNIRYLCNFTGSSALLVITKENTVFFSDGRYVAQAKSEVQGARIVISKLSTLISAAEWLLESHAGKRTHSVLGIESEHLTVSTQSKLSKLIRPTFKLKACPSHIERVRMVKDAEEVRLIRAAAKMGSSLFGTVVDAIRRGAAETEVAAELEYAARKGGAEQMSFATIIASGKRSALPHGVASAARIPAQGFVVCDFGVILAGYCSDMTRTVHVGSPTNEAKRVYESVLEAGQAAIYVVKPGVAVGEVDAAARRLLKKRGLARYFTHSTGHGVGLEIHEPPRIGAGQTEILRPGMIVTIEPGVYIPQKFGVRIEDMVLVTETGCEVLTPTTKELVTL